MIFFPVFHNLLKIFVETVETVENLSLNIKCCNLKIAGMVSRETMAHKKIAPMVQILSSANARFFELFA